MVELDRGEPIPILTDAPSDGGWRGEAQMRWGMRLARKDEVDRVLRGARWGLIAAIVMTILMLIDLAISRAPSPRTFPVLIIGRFLGRSGGAGVYLMALLGQLIYGALIGVVFAFLARPMTLAKGVGVGLMLWFLFEVEFIPWLGWGDFGFEHGGAALLYTLVMHVIYGSVLGGLGARDDSAHAAHFDDLGQLVA